MSATDPKGGESTCQYPRDVYPSRVLKIVEDQEAGVRRLLHDRWWRRVSALMPTAEPVPSCDFDGCVE